MKRNILALLLGVSALVASAACNSTTPAAPAPPANPNNAAPDGSTLKATAPTPQSPINDLKLTTTQVVLTAGPASTQFAAGVPLQYRFQVFNAANAMVQDSGLVSGTTWTVTAQLVGNTRHTWRARPEYQGQAGPWSPIASFIAADPALIFDPLTNGTTVGVQIGGHFVVGQGWMADSVTDEIHYDLATPCTNCTLEFDVTNFGKGEGKPLEKDLKWISMGDASSWDNFIVFRNNPWKMHLEQRADYDGTGMKLIWRNGDLGDGEPGDHAQKLNAAVDWRSDQLFHFSLDWSPAGFSIKVNGEEWFQDGFGGNAYAPPQHRIGLGCRPRAETFAGSAIWRNVKLTKKG
jgi:hypothetical protein